MDRTLSRRPGALRAMPMRRLATAADVLGRGRGGCSSDAGKAFEASHAWHAALASHTSDKCIFSSLASSPQPEPELPDHRDQARETHLTEGPHDIRATGILQSCTGCSWVCKYSQSCLIVYPPAHQACKSHGSKAPKRTRILDGEGTSPLLVRVFEQGTVQNNRNLR